MKLLSVRTQATEDNTTPPLSTQILISPNPLNIQSVIDWIMSPESGGIDIFIGTVRNATKGKRVLRLEFEAYEPMALAEMEKIVKQAFEKWPVQKALIHHRTGVLQVGEVPVIIAVSAAHRAAAFEACRYIIDTLKQTVPIWKKEVFADGEVWVAAHP
jgi:molybdopterin synthase catalytic subunit